MTEEELEVLWKFYPSGWPKCWFCELPVLDGHLTCGKYECPEMKAVDLRNEEFRRKNKLGEFYE